MKAKLHLMYLDWFNNFLTIARFASYYDITEWQARRVIRLGKRIHEKDYELHRSMA